jgi:hypothetical protein
MTKLSIKEMKDTLGGLACGSTAGFYEWDNMTCWYCNGSCYACWYEGSSIEFEGNEGC